MKLLLGQSQLAIRKCKIGNRTLTVGEIKTPEGLTNLICHDEGYKFLRALRGSTPYFEKSKKDLFAMTLHHYFVVFHLLKQNGIIY